MKLANTNLLAASIFACCFGCDLDASIVIPAKDGGGGTTGVTTATTTGTVTVGSTTTGTGGPGSGGTSVTTGNGGSAGASAGSGGDTSAGGAGGAPAGAAGNGGIAMGGSGGGDVDASDGSGGMGGMGGGLPEASTCAGYALQFDGASSYAFLTRTVQDSFTVEAWIQTTTSLTGTNFFDGNGLIYADVAGVANDFGLALVNNKAAFGIGNPDTTLLGLTDVTTGQWVHVAATRDVATGQLQVIVNGVADGMLTATNLAPLNAQTLITLGGNTLDARYFLGRMDEVRIWSVVKTAAEIAASMHQRLLGTEPNLVGYYRFDDPGGFSTIDSSPGANPASLSGGVLPMFVPSDAPICP